PSHTCGKRLQAGERAGAHRRRFGGGVQLADEADRAAGAAGRQELALEDDDPSDATSRQVERDRDSGDTAADDDDVGGTRHYWRKPTICRASAPATRRTGSPAFTEPGARTRAYTRLEPGWRFRGTRQ